MLEVAKITGKETVLDLGAGDARILIEAKKKYPKLTARGCEFVPTVWVYGKLRIWLSRQDVKLRLGNALNEKVSDADCIFMYLIPGIMDELEEKFDKELKKGTKVISYAFRFPNKKPIDQVVVPWITGERKLWIYKW